jgi:hypothetical protein
MKARPGGDVQNFAAAMFLNLLDKKTALAFRAALPVD